MNENKWPAPEGLSDHAEEAIHCKEHCKAARDETLNEVIVFIRTLKNIPITEERNILYNESEIPYQHGVHLYPCIHCPDCRKIQQRHDKNSWFSRLFHRFKTFWLDFKETDWGIHPR